MVISEAESTVINAQVDSLVLPSVIVGPQHLSDLCDESAEKVPDVLRLLKTGRQNFVVARTSTRGRVVCRRIFRRVIVVRDAHVRHESQRETSHVALSRNYHLSSRAHS